MILRWVIIMVLVVGMLSPTSQSLRFDIRSEETKCISEDMKSNSMTIAKYHVINPNVGQPVPDSHKFNVKVTSSHGHVFQSAKKVESGQFVFRAAEQGDYMTCFTAPYHSPQIMLTIDFDWRTGVHSKVDWFNVAKKGQVDEMEVELKKMYDTVNSIHEEMFYFQERGEEMQVLNQKTTSKMLWLSLVSLFLGLSVAGIQFWFLKTFFEHKKLV